MTVVGSVMAGIAVVAMGLVWIAGGIVGRKRH